MNAFIPSASNVTTCFGMFVSSFSISILEANPSFSIHDLEFSINVLYSSPSITKINSDFLDG